MIGPVRCWLGGKAVGPAPARNEIRFVVLEGGGELLDVCLRSCAAIDENEVRGDPSQIKRSECAEEVTAVNSPQTISEDEVVDDARPECVGHTEVFGAHEGETLEA